MLECEVYVITSINDDAEMFMKDYGVFDKFSFKQTKFFFSADNAKHYFEDIYGTKDKNYQVKKIKLTMDFVNDKTCNNCIHNCDEDFEMFNCYERIKNIVAHFERKEM